ncbi:MAG: RagB/SusD family nutrient uptake outer membrane protein [Agriterribacter sp.]
MAPIKKISIAAMILSGLFFSCSDKYLDITDKQNITEQSFWQTRENALEGITATYATLQGYDGSKWTFFEELYTTLTYRADDIENNLAEGYGRSIAAFTDGTDVSGVWNLWTNCYAGIGRANQVIEKVPAIQTMTEQEKNEIVGEAKFLRAYFYFVLVNGFENVPLVLTFEKDLDKLKVFQAAPEEVWAQIEKDLQEAEAVLPPSYNDAQKGRATKGAAKAMLGKVYLFREKWEPAETKFKEIYGQYSLLTEYENNFNGQAENSSESIFEIQFSGDRTLSDERHPFNYEVRPAAIEGWELFYPSDWLVTQMKKDTTATGAYSKRVYGSIFFDDPASKIWDLNTPANEISYSSVAGALAHPNYFKKYAYPYDKSGSYTGANVSLIRYADVLLMLAEALNENGKTNDAIDRINEVRARSGTKAIASGSLTKDQCRNLIRHHERPVELSMEFGIRWFDLIRWSNGTADKISIKSVLTDHGKPSAANFRDDKYIRYAIPALEKAVNPNLNQNNGY